MLCFDHRYNAGTSCQMAGGKTGTANDAGLSACGSAGGAGNYNGACTGSANDVPGD